MNALIATMFFAVVAFAGGIAGNDSIGIVGSILSSICLVIHYRNKSEKRMIQTVGDKEIEICGNCGTRLVYDIELTKHIRTKDGSFAYYLVYECPKNKWYNSCHEKRYYVSSPDYAPETYRLDEANKLKEKFNL